MAKTETIPMTSPPSRPTTRDERDTARPVPGADRRESPREPARDIAEIMAAASRVSVSCMIHNISKEGALIEAGTRELPDRFVLVNHMRRLKSVCRVVWRSNRMFGVRFLTAPRQFD